MTTRPVRLDRLQAGLTAWVSAMLPNATVVWAPSEYPRQAGRRQFVSLRLLTGPSDQPLGGASKSIAILPLGVVWRALAPTDTMTVGLRLSGRKWEYALQSGDDAEAARDGLLAVIGDEPMVSATFEASGTDAIAIEALELGDLYQPAAYGEQCEVEVVDDQVAQVQLTDAQSLIELQCFGLRAPMDGAADMMSRLISRLALPTAVDIFDAYGLTVQTEGAPASIDALSGPQWESRSVLSLRVTQIQLAAEPVGVVEGVRGTMETRTPPTLTIPFSVDVEP